MIKFATTFFLILLLAALTLPLPLLAANVFGGLVPCDEVDSTGQTGTDCNFKTLIDLFDNILGWLVKISVPVASALIVYGGLMMIIAPTDTGKREQAKKIFWSAVWGMVAILAAYLIIDTILSELTGRDVKKNLEGISLAGEFIYRL